MPTINRGDDYFQAGTYTGNGSTLTITGLRFQPDFVWIKGRSGATDHALYDAVRGVQKRLESNTTDAEVTSDGGVTAFTSDGFTVGSLAQVNTNGATYVYWAWKANGAGSSNTDGTITSTVSANTTSGFSIVTYTGTGANATVGHGLGVAPRMVIVKRINSTSNWPIYHANLNNSVSPQNYKVLLNSNGAYSLDTTVWNSTAPTSSVFSIGASSFSNVNSGTYVAYCFSEIAGFSKIGTYIPNGSADGPFVYLGFRPKFIMMKYPTAGIGSWVMYDSSRNPFNVSSTTLLAQSFAAQGTITGIDMLSNGFKLRGTSSEINVATGAQYIYMAFAEAPFKYSLAR